MQTSCQGAGVVGDVPGTQSHLVVVLVCLLLVFLLPLLGDGLMRGVKEASPQRSCVQYHPSVHPQEPKI